MYRPGDIFLQSLMDDFACFGACAMEVTDTPDYFHVEKVPVSIILGGYYYG